MVFLGNALILLGTPRPLVCGLDVWLRPERVLSEQGRLASALIRVL